MNKEISFRQIVYMFLFLSLSPILRQIPTALAKEAGRSGYLSPLWSVIAMVPLTGIILLFIKSYPGLNFYEIMVQILGRFLAKLFIFGYMLWFLLLLTAKINIYSLTLQFTLMPKTRSNYFMVILIILVYYALLKGIKTVFRFSELMLTPILLIFIILLASALTRVRIDYLLPVSTIKIPSTIMASGNVIAVGGNIIIALFFADKFAVTVENKQKRKMWYGILAFIVITFVITVFTYGITGADIISIVPFPFYTTVKSISFFNVFERFEVLVTLVCVLSDFITICILAFLMLRSLQWLFGLKEKYFLFIPLTVLVYYLSYFISTTQFEFDFLYRNVIIYLNMVFQFVIPLFLGLLCLFRRKKIKKQF